MNRRDLEDLEELAALFRAGLRPEQPTAPHGTGPAGPESTADPEIESTLVEFEQLVAEARRLYG